MSRQDAYALVIGIGRYRDPAITPLNFTNADAMAFSYLLTDENRCQIPEDNVRLLVDEDATLYAIKDAISGWLARKAGPESTMIIFYAGHGDVEPDRTSMSKDALSNYLLPYDANASNLYASALSKDEFQGLVRTVRCKRSVILMDACHSGGVATTGSRKMSVGYSRDLYSSLSEGAGCTVIAAAAPHQLSWEDKELGHGIFTHHLLEALRGEADLDGDGRITMTEVFDYLKRKVPESARKFGGAEQTPIFMADMSEDIVLTIDPEKMKRLTEDALKKAADERARIQAARESLFTFERENSLPARAHNLANILIEKPNDELSSEERGTLELMNAMIAGHVSVETFVRHCDSQVAKPDPKPEKREFVVGGGSGSVPPKGNTSPISKEQADKPKIEVPDPVSVKKSVSSEMNILIIFLTLVIPLVGFVAGIMFLLQADVEKKKAGKRWLIIACVATVCWLLVTACAAFVGSMNESYYY